MRGRLQSGAVTVGKRGDGRSEGRAEGPQDLGPELPVPTGGCFLGLGGPHISLLCTLSMGSFPGRGLAITWGLSPDVESRATTLSSHHLLSLDLAWTWPAQIRHPRVSSRLEEMPRICSWESSQEGVWGLQCAV